MEGRIVLMNKQELDAALAPPSIWCSSFPLVEKQLTDY
jgi:hypothetical protein